MTDVLKLTKKVPGYSVFCCRLHCSAQYYSVEKNTPRTFKPLSGGGRKNSSDG